MTTTTTRPAERAHAAAPERPAPRRPPSRTASLRAVVRRALRDRRRTPLSWGLPLAAFCALEVALFPSIEDSLDEMMRSYPESIKEAFGIRELNTVEKYLDAEMFSLIIPLALGFLAARSIARAVTVAEENGYLDTQLATPLTRRTLVAGSLIATAVTTALVLAVIWVISMLTGLAVGLDISAATMAAGAANVWPLAIFFAGLAMLTTGFVHRSAGVTAVAAGALVGMYVLDLVGKVSDPAEPFRVVSVFKYYGSAIQDGIDPLAFAGVTAAGLVLAVVGTLLFERRDVL